MFSRKASRRSSKASSAGADRLPADEESVPAVEVKSDATSSAMTVVTSSGQPPMMLAQVSKGLQSGDIIYLACDGVHASGSDDTVSSLPLRVSWSKDGGSGRGSGGA